MEMDVVQHARHAARVDKDDPFIVGRLLTPTETQAGRNLDFSRTRRIPVTLEERFKAGAVRLTRGAL